MERMISRSLAASTLDTYALTHNAAHNAAAHGLAAPQPPNRRGFASLSPRVRLDLIRSNDLLLLGLLAYGAFALSAGPAPVSVYPYLGITAAGLCLWLMFSRAARLYAFAPLGPARRLSRIVLCWGGVVGLLLGAGLALPNAELASYQPWLALWWVGGVAALPVSNGVVAHRVASLAQSGRWARDIVILGAANLGCRLAKRIEGTRESGLRIAGIFDDRHTRLGDGERRPSGSFAEALAFVRHQEIDCVIIALPLQAEARIMDLMHRVTEAPVDVYLALDAVGFHLPPPGNYALGGLPVFPVAEKPMKEWRAVVKSLEDKAVAAAALIVLAPLLAAVAVAIKLDSRGPILFRQPRCGFNERLFQVYKFRTMYVESADLLGDRLVTRSDPRVTRLGSLLRRTSIDELPQLINVLLGQMSIVGPRPHPINAKAANLRYSEVVARYAARHRVKPGITGWAQVNGWRGETDTCEKILKRVEHDLYYIEHWSIGLDLWIIAMTFVKGFHQKQAY
jgi:Undecaprenyl-phosphate glucose phosphotransferase